MNYEDLIEFDTKLTADVVEWRPISSDANMSNHNGGLLACGTYFLDKEKNQRLGCIYLLNYSNEKNELNLVTSLDYDDCGILDLKWINKNSLITIDSVNTLRLIKFDEENLKLNPSSTLSLDTIEANSIGLTLDYYSQKNSNSFKILTSDTKGFLNLVELNNSNFELIDNFKAHDYEIWSVLIDRNDDNIIYSGADDCLLKMWDLRQSRNNCVNKCNIFEGGICSIILPQRNNTLECLENYTTNQILCSSYDERVYVLDKRNMKKSLNQSVKLNGGVWKMKLHSTKNLLLCACMHTGVHIINTNNLHSELYYDKHGLNNLAYGCDWSSQNSTQTYDIVATCSFYNHNLRIWKVIY